MKKFTLLFFIFCLGFFEIKAQTPELINYQAVARDVATGLPKINQTGSVRMTIRNSVGGTVLYQETHSGVTTNQFGLFTVKIGGGTPVTGTFANINWSTGNKFLEVEVDYGSGYENMGTTQLVSVPYALYAKEALNGPAGKNSLMNITAIGNGATCPNGGYQVDVGTDVDGSGILDASEITGTFTVCNGDSGQSGAGINWLGTFATAPSNPNVNDAYYNSALGQSLIWDGTTWQIMAQDGSSGLTGGTGITIVGGVVNNTGDLDSLDDKINSAVLNGDTLIITEGSTPWSINLSSLINTNDTSVTNEIQTISLSGNTITLSNGGGTVNISTTPPGATGEVLTWNGTSWVAQPLPVDNDSLANNEIITNFNVNVTNDSLVIDEAGNHFAVPLTSLSTGDTDWTKTSTSIFNATDSVAIGTNIPKAPFHVSRSVGIVPSETVAGATVGLFSNNANVTDHARMVLLGGTSGQSALEFGDALDANVGAISYDHSDNSMRLRTDASSNYSLFLDNSDHVGIATANPLAPLHVNGANPVDTIVAIFEGSNPFGAFNITRSSTGNMVGELYISGADTVYKSLEPSKSSYYVNYPKSGGKIALAADTINFFSFSNSKVFNINDGDFYNTDTIKTSHFYVYDGVSAVGNVLTDIGGGRAVWQPLPGGSNLWVPNGNDIYNSNTGNVGIGTAFPSTKLVVAGGNFILRDQTDVADAVELTSSSGASAYGAIGLRNTGVNSVYLTGSGSSWFNAGNLGVGTNSPSTKFHIRDVNPVLRIQSSQSTTAASSLIEFGKTVSGAFSQQAVIGVPGSGDYFEIHSPNSFIMFTTNMIERMRITNSGDVGIGTFSPFSTLDVNGQITMRTGAMPGYIPVSNANGTMTWTDASTIPLGSAWLYNGTDIYNGNSGKVGVGISTPNALFHVQDVSSTGGDDLLNIGDFSGTAIVTVKDNGNVGIGLSTPLNPLDIAHTAVVPTNSAAHINYAYNGTGAGINSGLHIESKNGNGTDNVWGLYSNTTGITNAGMADIAVGAYSSATGAGDHIGIDAGANSSSGDNYGGIFSAQGTTTGSNYAIRAAASGGTNNWSGYFGQGNVYVADNLGIGTLNVINKLDVEGGIAIGTNYSGNFAAPTDGAIIEGSVGIGTASPAHKLHVVNSTLPRTGYFENNYTSGTTFGIYAGAYGVGTSDKRGGSYEAIGSSTNTNTGVRGWAQDGTNANYGGQFYANGSSGTNYGVYGYAAGATNNWSGYFASGDVYVADNVGIGTTTPTTTLHVNHPTGTTNGLSISNASDADKWHFYMYTTNDLTLYFNGAQRGAFDDVSGNYTATSDLRLKKNINSVSSVLDDVMKLNFVEYNYKGQKDNRKYFGFIAQEVEKVFPSLVYYQEESDLYLMDYSGFGSIAIKAIQEQQKMIDKQQQMIEELKKEIEALKNQK